MTRPAAIIASTAIAGTLLVGAAAAFGIVGGRRATQRRPKRRPRVIGVSTAGIQLERTATNTAPGTYRIQFGPGDAFSAVLGDVLAEDERTVTRARIDAAAPAPTAGETVLWTGYVFDRPEAIGAPFSDVTITTLTGQRAAYLFPAEGNQSRWAIHVHGIHSSRISALRSVPGTRSAGLTSLVVSYRGDVEDPATPPATLGQEEAHDVEAAIQYALDHGAKDVVLVGWSMGATISLILAATSPQRSRIAGLVLVGPALDWRAIIRDAARRSGIPSVLAPLFTAALTMPGLAHAVGLRRPLRAAHLRPPLDRTPAPVLILHSDGDTDAPLHASKRLVETYPQQVTLEQFSSVPHGMEWNSEPDRFTARVRQFITSLP